MPGLLDVPLSKNVYVGPEIMFRTMQELTLKANSSVGWNVSPIDTFYFFFTVPNSWDNFRNGNELLGLREKSKLKSPLF